MSVYNHENVVYDTIKSVINQTYQNLEIIIIDDCSTDGSRRIIKYFESQDKRVVAIYNDHNLGLPKNLNNGIRVSSGELIARFDADDVYSSDRIYLQICHMKSHPYIDVLGSNAILIDNNNNEIGKTDLPVLHNDLDARMPIGNPFVHSSIMAKRSFFISLDGYDEKLIKKQDYDLWARGKDNFFYENMPNFLMSYRVEYSKPFMTDLYGFYVRIRNGYRGGYLLLALYWAIVTLSVNIFKIGYRQNSICNYPKK
jgi:glycosyltransferase involved in cell wall biosynthesis